MREFTLLEQVLIVLTVCFGIWAWTMTVITFEIKKELDLTDYSMEQAYINDVR